MKKEIGSFVVGDSTKCTGCKACELACFTVHNRKSNHLGKTVGTVTVPVTRLLRLERRRFIALKCFKNFAETA